MSAWFETFIVQIWSKQAACIPGTKGRKAVGSDVTSTKTLKYKYEYKYPSLKYKYKYLVFAITYKLLEQRWRKNCVIMQTDIPERKLLSRT